MLARVTRIEATATAVFSFISFIAARLLLSSSWSRDMLSLHCWRGMWKGRLHHLLSRTPLDPEDSLAVLLSLPHDIPLLKGWGAIQQLRAIWSTWPRVDRRSQAVISEIKGLRLDALCVHWILGLTVFLGWRQPTPSRVDVSLVIPLAMSSSSIRSNFPQALVARLTST